MSKVMQNLVVFMEPSEKASDISLKGGNMILNRFCIDEDAAFELSGVDSLEKPSFGMEGGKKGKVLLKSIQKGKELSFLRI